MPKTGRTAVTENIGERIVRIRKERGITQKEVAALVGVTQPVMASQKVAR